MGQFELTVTIQDLTVVRAETQDNESERGDIKLDELTRDTIELFQDWLNQNKITKGKELEVLGRHLFGVIFNGRVESLFQDSLRDARKAGQRLRLQLSFEPGAATLASLPWEFLFYRQDVPVWLATDVDLVLSRQVQLRRRVAQTPATGESSLKILLVISQPQELGPELATEVSKAIKDLETNLNVKVEKLESPTSDAFFAKLLEFKPHVLHFTGHCRNDTERDEVALFDDAQSAVWVEYSQFVEQFRQARAVPPLVVLHICAGKNIKKTGDSKDLAAQLIAIGVSAVIAMQYPITNQAAIAFSDAFYRELAKGTQVDDAVQIARYRITTKDVRARESRLFGTPVLFWYSRDSLIQVAAAGQGAPPVKRKDEVASRPEVSSVQRDTVSPPAAQPVDSSSPQLGRAGRP
jgi:hypothetical protein